MWTAFLLALVLPALASSPADHPCAAADELWSRGQRQAALEHLEQELTRQPQDERLRLCLAERQAAVHRYAAALETLRPLDDRARALRAQAHWMLGHYAEATELLDREAPEEALLRVRGLLRLGRTAEADEALSEVAERLGAGDPRVALLDGQRLARQGRVAEAARVLEPLHAADPYDPELLFSLGRALVRAGQRERGLSLLARHRQLAPLFDELDFAQRGIDLAPLHAPGHARLGDIERAIGRTERAEAAYRRAWDLARTEELVPVALRLARLLIEDREDLEGSLELLDIAHDRTNDVRLLVRRGDVLRDAERTAEAAETYRRALALRPDDAAIRERLDSLGEGRE